MLLMNINAVDFDVKKKKQSSKHLWINKNILESPII